MYKVQSKILLQVFIGAQTRLQILKIMAFLIIAILHERISDDSTNFESQMLSYKQDTVLTILCNVNRVRAFVLFKYTQKIS
jgi:hypothetical protein